MGQGVRTIVAGTDADLSRLDLARKMGAGRVVNVNKEDLQKAIGDETGGLGADLVMECAGAAASVRNCLAAVRPLGRYTQVGHFGKDSTVALDPIAFKQLRVTGSVGYTAETWLRMLRILEQGTVQLGNVITHRLPLDRWKEGFDACEDKSALKVLLKP